MYTVAGPLFSEHLAGLNFDTVVSRGLYSVAFANANAFIRDQGVFVIDALTALPPKGPDAIVQNVANLFSGLYSGIVAVVDIQDSSNQRSTDELPPVLPHSLSEIRSAEATKIICPQHVQLVKVRWYEAQIEQTEQDHRNLRHVSSSEALFKELSGKCSDTLNSIEEGWGLCEGRFGSLRQFTGGLASMFPNTASAESDFLLIGLENTVCHQSLTYFLLEVILHVK